MLTKFAVLNSKGKHLKIPPRDQISSPIIIHNISSFISILMSQCGTFPWLFLQKSKWEGTQESGPWLFILTNLSRTYPSNSPFHVILLASHVILHQKQIILLKFFILNSTSSICLNIYYCLHRIFFARESIHSPYSQRTNWTPYPLYLSEVFSCLTSGHLRIVLTFTLWFMLSSPLLFVETTDGEM